MMVSHFLVVDNRTGIAGNRNSFSECHGIGNQIHQHRQTLGHVRSQIAAIRAGIGTELLFIQVLQIIQSLLGSISQQPIGIPLERSQVIEGRRFFRFVFAFHLLDRSSCLLTGIFQLFSGSLILHAFP